MSASKPVAAFSAVPDDEVPLFGNDEDHVSSPGGKTPLDELRTALQEEVIRQPITLPVPSRPGMSLTFDVNISSDLYMGWVRRCTRRNARNEEVVDQMKLACIVIANQNTSVIWKENISVGENGNPLSLRHKEFLAMLGTDRPVDAVRKLYAIDGHVGSVANAITLAAGFGEDVDEEGDPTTQQ